METTLFDVHAIRQDFPILNQKVGGKPLVYFDNAATTQKPRVVIDVIQQYYNTINSNIHRGLHTLAEKATAEYELTRSTVKSFINAAHTEEVIFTRGTTEGINLVAQTYGRQNLTRGDEVLISTMEHHSNIVPWQMICEEKGATLKVIPVTDSGELEMDALDGLLTERTKIVSLVYVSNSLGTINPVHAVISKAHAAGAVVLIDGAQATSHLVVDVQDMDADFFVFSAHKLYGPTGVGVLYGKKDLLEAMPPYQGGGEMIREVTFAKTTYNDLPYKFEAGTPNIADTIALRTSIEYINDLGKENMAAWEMQLLEYANKRLLEIDGLKLIGTAAEKVSVASFIIEGTHPGDVGVLLDNYGVAIRTGHHCTQPLMQRFGIPGTNRASFAFYNTMEEIDAMAEALKKVVKMLR